MEPKFSKFNNTFFVSSESDYFKTLFELKENKEKIESLDFIQRIILKEFAFDDFGLDNIYYLDLIEDYLDFIKFAKTEEKLINFKKKKSGKN